MFVAPKRSGLGVCANCIGKINGLKGSVQRELGKKERGEGHCQKGDKMVVCCKVPLKVLAAFPTFSCSQAQIYLRTPSGSPSKETFLWTTLRNHE